MRNSPIRVLVLALLLSTAAPLTTEAQPTREGKSLYFALKSGRAIYQGERDQNAGSDLAQYLEFSGLGLGFELGIQYSPKFTLTIYEVSGRYTQLITNPAGQPAVNANTSSRWRHTLGLMARRNFWSHRRLSPYLQLGLQTTFGTINDGTEIGFGPMIGLGMDFLFSSRLGIYLDLNNSLTFPDDGADLATLDTPYDQLLFLGMGLRYRFRGGAPAIPPIRIFNINGPVRLAVDSPGTYTADVNLTLADDPSVRYQWDFGDGNTATGQTVRHQYAAAGSYTVTFSALNDRGNERRVLTTTVVEPVQPTEIVVVSANPLSPEVNQRVQFSSTIRSSEPVNCRWTFGNGQSSTNCNPAHIYSEPGAYTVTLEASNSGGVDRRSLTVNVRAVEVERDLCAEVVELNTVYFRQNSSILSREAQSELQENITIVRECPNLNIEVNGFASPFERNVRNLSERRAQAVEQFYIDNGIPGSRLIIRARGAAGNVTRKDSGMLYRSVTSVPVR